MIAILENQNLLDWFETQENCGLIHCCNCYHTMGAGIALQIRRRYSEVHRADRKTEYADKNKLGTFSVACINESKKKYIYNLYSQFDYQGGGRKTLYSAMSSGLNLIIPDGINKGIKIFGVPYNMGCGLAGGDWKVVENVLKESFDKTDLLLVICKI